MAATDGRESKRYVYVGTAKKLPSIPYKNRVTAVVKGQVIPGSYGVLIADGSGQIVVHRTDPDYEEKVAAMEAYMEAQKAGKARFEFEVFSGEVPKRTEKKEK